MQWWSYLKRPRREHQIGPRTLSILVAICAMYVILTSGRNHPVASINCERGPLSTIGSCLQDHSSEPSLSTGWGFSYAHGTLDIPFCNKISLNPDELSVAITHQPQPDRIVKTDCKILGLDNSHFCYASQQLGANGITRIATIFTANANCGDAFFFRGSKAMLVKGRPQKVSNWKEPYTGITDVTETPAKE